MRLATSFIAVLVMYVGQAVAQTALPCTDTGTGYLYCLPPIGSNNGESARARMDRQTIEQAANTMTQRPSSEGQASKPPGQNGRGPMYGLIVVQSLESIIGPKAVPGGYVVKIAQPFDATFCLSTKAEVEKDPNRDAFCIPASSVSAFLNDKMCALQEQKDDVQTYACLMPNYRRGTKP